MSSNNSFAKHALSYVFSWQFLAALLVLGAVVGVAIGLSKAGIVLHYQDYKEEGFSGWSNDYIFPIVGIAVAFLLGGLKLFTKVFD